VFLRLQDDSWPINIASTAGKRRRNVLGLVALVRHADNVERREHRWLEGSACAAGRPMEDVAGAYRGAVRYRGRLCEHVAAH
jgi:hypothetical protein